MKNAKKHFNSNLQKANAAISFSFLLLMAFFVACSSSVTDGRDGQVYRTVQIGEQIWMAENLNFDPGQGGSGDAKYDWSWCYDDDPKKCEVFGRLYTWAAAIDSVRLYDGGNGVDCGYGKICKLPKKMQGICPAGWHLPTNDEWSTLFKAVGGKSTASRILKSQTVWFRGDNGTDAVGFAALPAGRRYFTGEFDRGGNLADFWSASGGNSEKFAFAVFLDYKWDRAAQNNVNKVNGHSIRCVKD